jgi:hypothetical protein
MERHQDFGDTFQGFGGLEKEFYLLLRLGAAQSSFLAGLDTHILKPLLNFLWFGVLSVKSVHFILL